MGIKSLTLATLCLVMAACGGKSGESSVNSTSLSYDMSKKISGYECKTGAHSFGSHSDFCSGLLNEGLNQFCARDLRETQYAKRCGALPVAVISSTSTPADDFSLLVADSEVENKFSYEMSRNGCTTGFHEFTTLDSLCDALLDDNLNNNCARDMRESYFKSECNPLSIH